MTNRLERQIDGETGRVTDRSLSKERLSVRERERERERERDNVSGQVLCSPTSSASLEHRGCVLLMRVFKLSFASTLLWTLKIGV